MSKKEFFVLFSVGFLVYILLIIRIGFFFKLTIGNYSLIASLTTYCVLISTCLSFNKISDQVRKAGYAALCAFVLLIGICSIFIVFLAQTYDTSWDGQGYHQTAIIALSNKWNPVYDSSIQLKQKLPSQVFAEGYPSALWELQASIFTLTGKINTAKVLNIYIGVVACVLGFILLRRLNLGIAASLLIVLLITLHPIYLIQLLTFMQDGFGYQLFMIAIGSLLIMIKDKQAFWAVCTFSMTILLLVSMKYSLVPIALALGIVFMLVIGNRLLNKEFTFDFKTKILTVCIIVCSAIFSYLPYVRNQIVFGALFYPTNIPNLMGSVKYNNAPNNVDKNNKLALMFYGIFSRSQYRTSGSPESKDNVANLKIPFTFTYDEVIDSASLYNNRAGANGPWFSGAVTLGIILLLGVAFRVKNRDERYIIYTVLFSLFLILALSLLTPTPNLQRYVTQIYLLPFAMVTPIYVKFKSKFSQITSNLIFAVMTINTIFMGYSVYSYNREEQQQVKKQLTEMKTSGKQYRVSAQHFYSNYVLLSENHIPFLITDLLNCPGTPKSLRSSSTTTRFCEM